MTRGFDGKTARTKWQARPFHSRAHRVDKRHRRVKGRTRALTWLRIPSRADGREENANTLMRDPAWLEGKRAWTLKKHLSEMAA